MPRHVLKTIIQDSAWMLQYIFKLKFGFNSLFQWLETEFSNESPLGIVLNFAKTWENNSLILDLSFFAILLRTQLNFGTFC